ncbi:MAG: flagellar hook capping protein [Opitutales bacterium]|nr:flagellar hook capping protein [Opitutales bacterium]
METNIATIQQPTPTNTLSTEKFPSPNQDLNMEDFFKLLTVQLTSQDPLKPMDDTEFISQMTAFSSLAELESMGKDMKALRQEQNMFNAQMLIGKEVTATTRDGQTITGAVTRVARENGEMIPYIGDTRVDMANIKEVAKAEKTFSQDQQ